MENFRIKEDGDLKYLESGLLSGEEGIKHFFSTKIGGVSSEEYKSLNLGIYTNDSKESVEKNFDIICSSLKMNKNIAYLNQEHGKKVYIVTKENVNALTGKKGDAIITNEKNIPIGIFTADCLPILLYDKKEKVIGAIHAGWRGVEGKILTETLKVMKKNFNSDPLNIICAVGPCINKCCFEVSEEVAEKFNFIMNKNNSIYVDLLKEIYSECIKENISEKNIDMSNICTVCEKDTFYSYRGDNGKTGRIGSFIEIV